MSANRKLLVRHSLCAGSPERLLVAHVISTIFSCDSSNGLLILFILKAPVTTAQMTFFFLLGLTFYLNRLPA